MSGEHGKRLNSIYVMKRKKGSNPLTVYCYIESAQCVVSSPAAAALHILRLLKIRLLKRTKGVKAFWNGQSIQGPESWLLNRQQHSQTNTERCS